MDFKDFTAGPDDDQRRLDKVLRNFLDSSRLSEIYKLIRKGLIKVNHKKSTPEYRVVNGDIISIAAFLFETQQERKIENKIENWFKDSIVFENQHILIINKPYDKTVHGSEDSLDKAVTAYYNSKNMNTSLSFAPGPLHRLDRKTTGLLAFSFSIEGARWFTENIKNHSITKKYYGIVQGNINTTEEWKDYISKNDEEETFSKVTASSESDDGKEAVTIVTPISSGVYKNIPVTFVSFDIKTGRKHQIRSQSSLHKHPLLGDTAYNGAKLSGESRDFYLQAYELLIPENPVGLPSKIKLSPSEDLAAILKYCGIVNKGL